MSGSFEAAHPRGMDGKFTAKPAAEQEGAIAEDSGGDSLSRTDDPRERLRARTEELGALITAICYGSPYREDRRGGPVGKIGSARARLDPNWQEGSNELGAIAALDEACGLLDARAAASGTVRDREQAASAAAIRDALWEEYQPRDVTGTVILPGDEVEVTRPNGTVGPLSSPEEARALPPGAMRITSRPALAAHPADLYPNLAPGDLPEEDRRAAAADYAARAVRHGRYLPFGKTAATATRWEVEKAEADAALHAAILANQRAWERAAPQRRMADARQEYDRETGGTPAPHVPPVLRKNGDPGDDGTFPVIDQDGREYQVRLNGGTVTVTFEEQSKSAPASASPTRTARQLAGTLSGSYTPATGPHARLAEGLRGIADELYALDPRGGFSLVDYSGAAPELLTAARLFDSGQVKEGQAALSRASRELKAWQADEDFRGHIGNRSRLTPEEAARYAGTLAELRKKAGRGNQATDNPA